MTQRPGCTQYLKTHLTKNKPLKTCLCQKSLCYWIQEQGWGTQKRTQDFLRPGPDSTAWACVSKLQLQVPAAPGHILMPLPCIGGVWWRCKASKSVGPQQVYPAHSSGELSSITCSPVHGGAQPAATMPGHHSQPPLWCTGMLWKKGISV